MSRTDRFDCPRCGAPLHAEKKAETAHCTYCNEDVPVPWARDHHRARERDSSPPPGVPPKKSGAPLVLMVLGLGVAAGGIYYLTHHHAAVAGGLNDVPVTISHDAAEDVEWDAQNDPPTIATVGHDEDFVGAFWIAGKGETRKDHSVYVGLFDGTTHEREWYAGPFGRFSQGKGSTHFAFASGHVLMTDYRGIVYGFDALSGKEQFSTKLPDRARGICTAGSKVWIDVVGDRSVTLDPNTGTTTSAPSRPDGCRAFSSVPACESIRSKAECVGPEAAPKVAGFKPVRALFDGNLGVALGTSDAAKPVPMAVGFDRTTAKVGFSVVLPPDSVTNVLGVASSIAEVTGGRAYIQYELKDSKWRLACLDATTGARIWDIVVPGSKHGDEARSIAFSSSRLYLSHGDWLDIFDIQTGGALGEFGR